MYDRFYGFKERPFSLLPDPDFLFLGEKHRTALDLLELGIFNQSGFCVVSGEIGAGKTTLIRELLNRLSDDVQVGLVSNTHPSFGELMQWIMAAYGLKCGTDDRIELHRRFIDFLIRSYADNKRTLLIIDEAQNLAVPAMEELRMLSNVNSDKDFVLQVILIGQSELRDKLRRPELEQFAQRIALDYHLTGLDEAETCQYIEHRLVHAGGSAQLFSDAACRVVYRLSKGIPRLINRICDLSLVYGYSEAAPLITPELVELVINDQHMANVLEAARNVAVPLRRVDLKAVGQNPVSGMTSPVEGDDAAAGDEPMPAVDTMTDNAIDSGDASLKELLEPAAVEQRSAKARESFENVENQDGQRLPADEAIAETMEITVGEKGRAMEPSSAQAQSVSPATDLVELPGQEQDVALGKNADTEDEVAAVETLAVDDRVPTPDDTESRADGPVPLPVSSELHELVVSAGKHKRPAARSYALWAAIGIMVTAGGAGWLSRDLWYRSGSVDIFMTNLAVQAGAPGAVDAAGEQRPQQRAEGQTAQRAAGTSPETGRVEQDSAQRPDQIGEALAVATPGLADEAEEVTFSDVAAAGDPDPVAESAQAQAASASVAVAPPDVTDSAEQLELRREAERLAQLKREADRLQSERRAAEKVLAEQRRARQLLERKARLEREKILQSQRAMEKMARERARAEQELRAVVLETESLNREATPANAVTMENNGQMPLVEVAEVASHESPRVGPVGAPEAGTVSLADEVVAVETAETPGPAEQFLSNPCNGPTARFMSTCF